MHFADAFIQRYIHFYQFLHSLGIKPIGVAKCLSYRNALLIGFNYHNYKVGKVNSEVILIMLFSLLFFM